MKSNWRKIIFGILILAGAGVFLPLDASAVQVKKIQRGNVYFDLDDTSIPVAIDSVDQTKSIILLYVNADSITGSSDTSASENMLFSALFESNNSIVVERAGATYGATVTYYVVEFADGVTVQRGISSFLYGSYNNPNYRIKDVTLPQSLDNFQNAFAIVQTRSAMTVSTAEEMTEVSGQILDSNTFRLERSSSADNNKSVNIVWQVVELKTDASLRTGENNIGVSAVTNTSTVSPAIGDLNRTLLMFGNRAKSAIDGQEGRYYAKGSINNNTTVSFSRGYQSGLANTELYQRWTTIELTDPSSLVQSGTVQMGSTTTDTLVSLGTAIDDSRSVPIYSQFANGTTTTSTYEPMLKVSAEFDGPRKVCYHSGTNSAWAVNYYSDSVTKYNATTGAAIGTYGTGFNPIAVACDNTNNAVWTANYFNNSVTKLNASTGAVINANITVGANPIDIEYAQNSNQVWTVNYGAATSSGVSRIYANNGTFISNNTTNIANPTSICYDPAGYMWVVYWGGTNSRAISRYNSTTASRTDTGNLLSTTSEGSVDISFAQTNGTSLGYNSVWVTALRTNTIYRIRSPAYNATNSFPVDISPRASVWDNSTNTMWVVSYGEDTLSQLIADNTTSGSDIILNSTATDVNPYGLTIDTTNNKIWVANAGENTVQKFNTTPGLEGTFRKSPTEDKLAMARVNTGAAVDISWYMVEFSPVTLKTPNGGGFYRVGQAFDINWTFADSAKDHNIDLMLNTSNSTNISNYTLPINTTINMSYNSNGTNYGRYNWTIPESLSGTNLIGNLVRMGIIDNNLSVRNYDYSNNAFEIKGDINLTAPDGGEVWNVSETRQINWTRYGNMSASQYNITISTDGGGGWNNFQLVNQSDVDGDSDGNCVYSWVIADNDPTGTNMKVKVSWMGDQNNVYDSSTNNFTVRAKINVTEPTAVTEWLAFDNGTINWTKTAPGREIH
jgi:DNA-binding beta-propeller fold protein YncE